MRLLRSTILPLLLVAALTCGGCTVIAARAASHPATARHQRPRPHRPAKAAPARICDVRPPKARQACLRYVRHLHQLAVAAYLDAIWTAAWETVPASLVATENCVKGVESGDYSESSHPRSGSGAFQMIPSTFAAYFARWATASRYDGPAYALAYESPPGIQDGVFAYMLLNGGAGNYSGVDGCTGH